MRGRTVAYLLALLLAAPALAQVDEGFNAQNFQPPIDPYGYITLNGARALPAGRPFFAAYIDWAEDPLDLTDIREGEIEKMTFVHAIAAIGLWNFGDKGGLTLGVEVPYALEMHGFGRDPGTGTPDTVTPPAVDLPNGRLSDIRGELKLTLLDRTEVLGVALRGWATAPTGEDKYFLSNDERIGAGGGLVLEKEIGPVRIGAEGLYEWLEGRTVISQQTFPDDDDPGRRRLLIVDDKVHLRAGVATRLFVDDLWFVVEGYHWTRAGNLWETQRESPIELGAAIRFDRGLFVLAGASAGLNDGVGAPDVRLYGSVGFAFGSSRHVPDSSR